MENDIKDILAINPYPKIDFDKINALLEWVKDEKNVSSYSDYQKKINELTEPELNWFNKKVEIEIKQKMSNIEKLAR
tara:strand:- start:374 stop:604 length:231 start_codon:yes stop_codon:yes gene_type:complete